MNIKRVCIVGGGSSGWMTAAALAKLCPHIKVTLVESPNIKTVGVGESTLGHINRYMRLIGLKDEEWMPACNATYKNSIRFTNFRENNGSHFEYPFVDDYDFTYAGQDELTTWNELTALYPEEFGPKTFAEFHALSNTLLATHNKQTNNADGKLRHFNFAYDTAYHMDATAFGIYLRDKICLPAGVTHIKSNVIARKHDQKGNTHSLLIEGDRDIGADLFIDCSGFKSFMLEGWQGSIFHPYHNILANDSAWAVRIPFSNRIEQMHNVTDCHALGNGWVWNIPLWNRIGTGYVFSSRFTTKEDALVEFKNHLKIVHNKVNVEELDYFHIPIKHGKRIKAWVGNVVGIGLSYGFVEPLESTGLLTTHENIINLTAMLNMRKGYVTRSEVEVFNNITNQAIDQFARFVSNHYALSMRQDTPYWRWATQKNEYDPELNGIHVPRDDYNYNSFVTVYGNQAFNPQMQGMNFIMAGMGIRPVSSEHMFVAKHGRTPGAEQQRRKDLEIIRDRFLLDKEKYVKYIDTLPTHYEYLKQNIYGGVDEHDV